MDKKKPSSISLKVILCSILNNKRRLSFFRNLVLAELKTYKKVRRTAKNPRLSPSAIELERLNALIRLLKKHPLNIEKILAGTSNLHISTQTFLSFEVKKLFDFNLDIISKRSAAENHMSALAALENTRIYFRDRSGSRYSTEELNLARALARIYESASGKKFGVGSSTTTRGPDYMTPSEQFLYSALKLANKHTTIEGMRELYRASHRHKKGTKKPTNKRAKTSAKTITRRTQ